MHWSCVVDDVGTSTSTTIVVVEARIVATAGADTTVGDSTPPTPPILSEFISSVR